MSTFKVIPSSARDHWRDSALISRQSFPATGNFDLAANAYGLLMVHNDDVVGPGEGFDMHQHDNVEIITWVVAGQLRHRDNGADQATELGAGFAQHISAGSGVRHSEVNAAGYTSRSSVRVVQSWLPADHPNTVPHHASYDFNAALTQGDFIQIAGPKSPLPIGTAGAQLWVARPKKGVQLILPHALYLHVYLIHGAASIGSEELAEGDVARLTEHPQAQIHITADSEILVWAMGRGLSL